MHELKLYEVQKKYKDKTAVKQVSYTFKHGVYGLLGENGEGKTTLMRLICGVLQPTTGNIYYDGMEIAQMGAEYRRLLGYLPQELGEQYDYLIAHNIQPVGYMPLGSPRRPERDICPEDDIAR